MKWTIEYIKDKRYIRVNSEGKFNHKDHQRKMEEIVSKDYWKPGMNILFDCTKVDFSGRDLDDVRKVVSDYANKKELFGRGRVALLMKSLADFGRGRQLQILTTETTERISADVRVFLNEKQSPDWLEASDGFSER